MEDIRGAAIFDFYRGLFTTWYNFSLMQRLRYDAGHRFPL